MNTLWFLLAFWLGTMTGFFAFALMAMARDADETRPHTLTSNTRAPARHRALRVATASARS
jgi:hypothetical protein